MKRRKKEIENALDAAKEAQSDYWNTLSALEEAIGMGILAGLDELDLSNYDADTLVAWAEEFE